MSFTIATTYAQGFVPGTADNPLTILSTGRVEGTAVALYGAIGTYWTIDNAGTVLGGGNTTAIGAGIYLKSGGIISNATAAMVGAYNYGIVLDGAGSVLDNGVITATATAAAAVFLLQGGSVDNLASGTIAGGKRGIYATGQPISVTNAGTIAGTLGAAIFLAAGGTVDNAGGTISGGAIGVLLDGSGAVTNQAGFITGYNEAVLMAPGGLVDNQAAMAGGAYGVLLDSNATLINSGTISNTRYYNGATVELRYGGSLTNGATGTISGHWIGVGVGVAGTAAATIVSTIVNAGSIGARDVRGDGADLWLRGPAYVRNTGIISAGPFGVVLYGPTTVVNLGTIAGADAIAPGSTINAAPNIALRLEEAPGAVLSGLVIAPTSTLGAAANTLELLAGTSAGTISGFASRYQGFGNIAIDPGAQWLVAGTAAGFAGVTIAGFAPGSTLELTGTAESYAGLAGGLLTLSGGTTLDLAGTARAHVASAGGNTFITACFATGTKLLAARGAVGVEALREGDLLATTAGLAPVRWIGRRRTDLVRHPRPHDVLPVRIRAGAFAPSLPARDLVLSPDHAVYVDGVLVPVRHLANGISIVQERRDHITYWHVELPRHAIVLAEGLACETYLDTGNRCAFENVVTTSLHPDFGHAEATRATAARAVWAAQGCAAILTDPADPALRAVHTRLLARARRYASATSTSTGTWSEGCALARSSLSGAA